MYEMKPFLAGKTRSLKTERKLRGWSQARLAEELGVATRTVIRWERGLTVPQPNYRKQLGTLFGKSAQELGLLWNANENEGVEAAKEVKQMPLSVAQWATLEVAVQTSLLTDTTIPQTFSNGSYPLGRAGLLIQLKERLLDTKSLPFMALYGLPGIGKTTLAMALITDQEVQARFRDGILWAPLGPQPHMLGQLIHWGTLLGVTPGDVENSQSCQAWSQALRSAIGTRQMLLVIDDAWTAEEALAFQIGGPECTHLLTTRLPQVAFTFAESQSTIVPQLEEADGLVLLARFIPHLIQQDPEGARSLVQALGCLPLALTLMGKYLALPAFTDYSWPLRAALAQVHDTQERLRLSMPITSGKRYHKFGEIVPLSLYASIAICTQQLSPQAYNTLCALAIFPPKPHSFSEEAALAMSLQPRAMLDVLCHIGLLESQEPERYSLHQAVAQYIRARTKSEWYSGER